ncbi:ABC transporter permease [Mobiluncus curtisii]|uniref:ABC transporter permease n=1 Tax=Mobiluncus curtisii TaxID=2051 RepID=UPI0014702F66|nr:ABC transporter permease [Mobiluncus curtisii]MCU9986356.1 ABC transporter permease [Mobiluncus curtisii]MCV0000083.1 ABC transporter permease [Mobiluncus curtisii]MCV0021824.1 ABC transporter permease [Mobiluncus curtisii]NMW48654.1 ABC transporter permease [Mobiluncus curtisii]NMX13073.1 ABC transporter permease [Mobiluncus curtisii]
MFAKLFKCEAQEMGWQLLLYLVLGLVVVFTSGLLSLTNQSFLAPMGTTIGAVVSIIIPFLIFIMGSKYYYQTTYGQRGYFTNTLPASGGIVLGAKSLWLFITVLLSICWSCLALTWVIFTQMAGAAGAKLSFGDEFVAAWEAVGKLLQGAPVVLIVFIIVTLLLAAAQFVLWVVCFSALANRFSFAYLSTNKAVTISAILIYVVYEAVLALFTFLVPVTLHITSLAGDAQARLLYGAILSRTNEGTGVFLPLGTLSMIPLLIVGYWFAHHSLSRHLSLR